MGGAPETRVPSPLPSRCPILRSTNALYQAEGVEPPEDEDAGAGVGAEGAGEEGAGVEAGELAAGLESELADFPSDSPPFFT